MRGMDRVASAASEHANAATSATAARVRFMMRRIIENRCHRVRRSDPNEHTAERAHPQRDTHAENDAHSREQQTLTHGEHNHRSARWTKRRAQADLSPALGRGERK